MRYRRFSFFLLLLSVPVLSGSAAAEYKPAAEKQQTAAADEFVLDIFQNQAFSRYYLESVPVITPAAPQSPAGPFYQAFTGVAFPCHTAGFFFTPEGMFKAKAARFLILSGLLFPFHSFT